MGLPDRCERRALMPPTAPQQVTPAVDNQAVTPYLVRNATPGDLSAVRDVYRRSSLSNSNDRAALLTHPHLLIWSSDGISSGRTRVATDTADAVVGFATLKHSEAGLELEDLFVDPDRMRTGVGTLLVSDAGELAASSGQTSIDVTANPHAAEFYAAVGFITVGVAHTLFGAASRLRLVVTPGGWTTRPDVCRGQ